MAGRLVPESMLITCPFPPLLVTKHFTRLVWQSILSKDGQSKLSHPTGSAYNRTWTFLSVSGGVCVPSPLKLGRVL